MPDLIFLMESRLAPEQLAAVQQVQAQAHQQGLNLFLVGGALRDMLGGQPIRDLDFATEGNPAKTVRALEKQPGVELLDYDEQRREAHLVFPGGVTVEIVQCRSERYEKTGQEPEVSFAPIHEDLRRRDFSMNAIGLSLNPASRGLVLDPNNGAGDIERHEIRAISNYVFVDDPVRMLRLVRFRARLHFGIDAKTESQFESAKQRDLLQYALPRQLLHELREITHEMSTSETIKTLDKEGMMAAFHPKLTGPRLNLPAIQKMEKTARSLEDQGLRPLLYGPCVFFLTQKLTAADRAALAKRLHMKRADTDPWMKLEEEGKKLVRLLGSKEDNTPSKAFRVLSAQPAELVLFVLLHFPQKKVQDKLKAYLSRHRPLREKLPEKELASLGVPPGSPRFSQILEQFFTALLDGKVKSRTEQIKYLKKLASAGS
jgi:tRNA nucleotidyltransferase (CCA-adding enzyme)